MRRGGVVGLALAAYGKAAAGVRSHYRPKGLAIRGIAASLAETEGNIGGACRQVWRRPHDRQASAA